MGIIGISEVEFSEFSSENAVQNKVVITDVSPNSESK